MRLIANFCQTINRQRNTYYSWNYKSGEHFQCTVQSDVYSGRQLEKVKKNTESRFLTSWNMSPRHPCIPEGNGILGEILNMGAGFSADYFQLSDNKTQST